MLAMAGKLPSRPMRPTATVIVPFLGEQAALDALLECLAALPLGGGDEVLVADNRHGAGASARGTVRVIPVPWPRSSYSARNAAARQSGGDWLVFIDADCEPSWNLLDVYLDPPPGPGVGVLAGAVRDVAQETSAVGATSPASGGGPAAGGDAVTGDGAAPGPPRPLSLAARYVVARAKMDQASALGHSARPYAQTANCAVRRCAFESAGGFAEGVRSGGDADLCWRLQAAGWRLEERSGAIVGHRARATAPALLRQLARHGAGMAWLEREHAGAFPPPGPRELAGRLPWAARRATAALRAGQQDEVAFALLDAAGLYARDLGRLRSNRAPR